MTDFQDLMPDWDAIYQDRVLPALGVPSGGADDLRWIFVCGQPGSGKSTLIRQLLDELGPARTQEISSDALADLLPEIYSDAGDPGIKQVLDAFQSGIRQAFIDALIERAVDLRAHILWERPSPTDTADLAVIARALGYRVECVVLAVPLVESWLATMRRETLGLKTNGRVPRRIAWARQCVTYSRWPGFLARAEDQVAFDEVRIIGRNGETFYNNTAATDGDRRRWTDTPFAFESLMIERLHPRTGAQVKTLLAEWEALRIHPDVAFRNHDDWPHAATLNVGRLLHAMCDDPAVAFDLNDPTHACDRKAAAAWIRRLRGEIKDVLNNPEAEGQNSLGGRCERFLALVEQVAGQPTR